MRKATFSDEIQAMLKRIDLAVIFCHQSFLLSLSSTIFNKIFILLNRQFINKTALSPFLLWRTRYAAWRQRLHR